MVQRHLVNQKQCIQRYIQETEIPKRRLLIFQNVGFHKYQHDN